MSTIKNAAKITRTKNTNRPASARRFNSDLFPEPVRVEVEKPGVRMYITDARLTIIPKESKDGTPYEKVYIHGFDALGGLTISGLEFDGPRFEGTIPFFNGFKYRLQPSGYWVGDGSERQFIKTGEYRHLGDGFEADSEEQFWADVERAKAAAQAPGTAPVNGKADVV